MRRAFSSYPALAAALILLQAHFLTILAISKHEGFWGGKVGKVDRAAHHPGRKPFQDTPDTDRQTARATVWDMTLAVNTFNKQGNKTEGEAWEAETLANSVWTFSALRDPVEETVRIFFDAVPGMHGWLEECHFGKEPHPADEWLSWGFDAQADKISAKEQAALGAKEVAVRGKLTALNDQARLYDGYMLECEDPGRDYTFVVFRSHDNYAYHRLIKTVAILEVGAEEKHVFSMCTAPLFSKRVGFESWLTHTLSSGITHIDAYFTEPDKRALNNLNGLRMHKDTWEPFVPIPSDDVQYFRYHSPISRFYFSQSTLLNDCMYRNRYTSRYIVFADADEYIHVQQPRLTLEAAVEQYLGDTFASVLLNAIHYPRSCQQQGNAADSGDDALAEDCHLFDPHTVRFDYPKSIVNPRRGGHYVVHSLESVKEGFRERRVVNETVMFFKHIRNFGQCDDEYRQSLSNDRDARQIEQYIDSGPTNQNWMHEP